MKKKTSNKEDPKEEACSSNKRTREELEEKYPS